MNTSSAQGACQCGAVRFVVTLPSKWVAHCHCQYCRRAHGAPLVTWAGFERAQFALADGSKKPRWYASSPGARRGFCPTCGSPMLFESKRWPGEVHVARALIAGALDKPPAAHVFYESHVPWLDINDALPKKVSASVPPAAATARPATHPPPVGYSGTPLVKKLGIQPGMRVVLLNAPPDHLTLLGELPAGVTVGDCIGRVDQATGLVHLFVTERDALAAALATLRRQVRDDTPVWVSWPKKASRQPTTVTEDVVRALALPLGFVDIKVCAVSDRWSALKLVVRRALRGGKTGSA